jgi:CHAT domain-containing protein
MLWLFLYVEPPFFHSMPLNISLQSHPDDLNRIWWCPTGPLAFLPIHAAGIYGSESPGNQLSDYVISSYIPTVSALLAPSNPVIWSSFKLLSVIQASAPGAASIPQVRLELDCIRKNLVNHYHVILEGCEATKRRVTGAMKDTNWVHLACHGTQRPDEPFKSALLLEDGQLTIEDIMKLELPEAEFAFLSACQTTAGDEGLSEEAVHIAGAMLLAGYRGAVATMWSIQDEIAPEVADGFYSHLTQGDQRPDPRGAAEALHHSIQRLRKRDGIKLIDWVAFVHVGI